MFRVLRLRPEARLPERASAAAAGLDLRACLPDGPLIVEPQAIEVAPTGLAVAIPLGFEGQIRPRSGLASKHGLTLPNAPGTIDADYRGEVRVPLINLGRAPFVVEHAMRIAQLVLAPVALLAPVEVRSLDETARGSGGFGSTGLD